MSEVTWFRDSAPVAFPGGHGGFLGGEYGQTGEPDAFAATLRTVLVGWPQDHCPSETIEVLFTERTEVLAPVRPVVLRGGDVDMRSA